MNKLSVCAVLSAAFLLAACNGQDKSQEANSCSSSEASELVASMVKEDVEKSVADFLKTKDTAALGVGIAEVRNALAQIKLSLGDVRTTEKTDTSSKRQCEASLQLELPESMLAQAVATTQMLSSDAQNTDFFEGDYRREGRYYVKNISYSVQPTDDGSKLFVTLNTPQAVSEPIKRLVGLYVLSQPVKSQTEARESELAALNAEQMQAQLKTAGEDYKLAEEDLNQYWHSLPERLRNRLKNSQTAWVASRDSSCTYEAQSASQDAAEQQLAALNCKTEKNRTRIAELQQMVDAAVADMTREAQQNLNQAKQRLQTALNKLPKEIADQLAGDYNRWAESVPNKCAANDASDSVAADVDALNCSAKEFNLKAKELEGYSIN